MEKEAKRETWEAIAEEMRSQPLSWLSPEGIPQMNHDNDELAKYADRIDAAVKLKSELLVASTARVRELEGLLGGAACSLLGAAIEQKRGTHEAIGNAAALRAALVKLIEFTCRCCQERYCEEPEEFEDGRGYSLPCNAILEGKHALAAPPRNCDVGTVAEQNERYKRFCARHYQANNVDAQCDACPCKEERWDCELEWAQLPYEATATPEKGGEG